MKSETTRQNAAVESWLRKQGPLVALLVLCFLATAASSTFLTPVNLANILRQASLIGLVSVGMALVIVSGGIDLSVGSIAAVSSVLAAQWSIQLGLAAAPAVVLVGVLIGAVNGMLVTRVRIPPFIATLSVMLGARGLAFALSDAEPVALDASSWLWPVAKADLFGVPCVGILFLLTLGAAILVAEHTHFGRSLYAIGGGVGKMGHTLYGVLILGVIPNIINSRQSTLTPLDNNVITGILLLAVVLLQSRAAHHEPTVGDAK